MLPAIAPEGTLRATPVQATAVFTEVAPDAISPLFPFAVDPGEEDQILQGTKAPEEAEFAALRKLG